MPRVWGGEDIPKEKTVFVWPSASARADKVDMVNVTFTPGMSENQVKQKLVREFHLECDPDDIVDWSMGIISCATSSATLPATEKVTIYASGMSVQWSWPSSDVKTPISGSN